MDFAKAYAKRVPADQRSRILAVSGADDLNKFASEIGAAGYLPKPFDPEELLRQVAALLEPAS